VYTDRILMMDAVDESEIVNMPLGEAFRRRFGNPYAVSHRADLHLSLLEGVKESGRVELATSTHVERIEQHAGHVIAIDTQGRSHRGAALIGCDGVKSVVRQQFVGDPVRVTGHVVYRAVVDESDFPAEMRVNAPCLWAGPDCHVVHYPLRDGHQYNLVVTFHSHKHEEWGVTDGSREEVLEHFQGIGHERMTYGDFEYPRDLAKPGKVLKIEVMTGVDAQAGGLCRPCSRGEGAENQVEVVAGECLRIGLCIQFDAVRANFACH